MASTCFSVPDTPCLYVDEERMKANIAAMANHARACGVKLRPHIKTHKSPEIAKLQIAAGATGLTVAKLSEAEVLFEHGLTDFFMAYPIIGENRIRRALSLNRKCRLILSVDGLKGASALSVAAIAAGQRFEVRVEVDIGFERTGLFYDEAGKAVTEIARLPGLRVTGIYAFRGPFMREATRDFTAAALEEGAMMAKLADELRRQGLDIRDVSVGSTPTARDAAKVPGVTEVRPGTYVFNDMMQHRLGVCGIDDCAAYVVCTVVSSRTERDCVIDGGYKAFAGDCGPGALPYDVVGYGTFIDRPGWVLKRLSEEHGMVAIEEGAVLPRVGERVKVIPNHICTVVNLQDELFFEKKDGSLAVCQISARGKSR